MLHPCSCSKHLTSPNSTFLKLGAEEHDFSEEPCSTVLCSLQLCIAACLLYCPHSSTFRLLCFLPIQIFVSNVTAFPGLQFLVVLFKPFLGDIFSALKVVPKLTLRAGFEAVLGVCILFATWKTVVGSNSGAIRNS